MSYRTSRSSGYGYECPTELKEVLCREIPGVNTPGTVCTCPTEHNLAILSPRALSSWDTTMTIGQRKYSPIYIYLFTFVPYLFVPTSFIPTPKAFLF